MSSKKEVRARVGRKVEELEDVILFILVVFFCDVSGHACLVTRLGRYGVLPTKYRVLWFFLHNSDSDGDHAQ